MGNPRIYPWEYAIICLAEVIMASPVLFENRVYSFIEFIEMMAESFQIKDVTYGTNENMDNGKSNVVANISPSSNFKGYYTFFKLDDLFFNVTLRKMNSGRYDLSFSVRDKFSLNPFEYYNMEKFKSSNVMKIFNNVLNIAFNIMKSRNINKISFSGEDPRLGKVYNIITGNKSFIKILNDNGYKHTILDNGLHLIEKIP